MENKPVERNTAREAEALEKEKRAKNQAWDFITQRGLLDDFLRYVESGQLPPTHDKRPQTGHGRRIEVSRYSLERLAHVVRGVRSPLEWVEGLASILRGYSEMLSDIQNGVGGSRRMQDEDPAAVLDSLRERYAPDASEEHDRAYFLADFIELLQVADGVAGFV